MDSHLKMNKTKLRINGVVSDKFEYRRNILIVDDSYYHMPAYITRYALKKKPSYVNYSKANPKNLQKFFDENHALACTIK